jgi:hypothetical protein
MFLVACRNVSLETLSLLKEQLESFGCVVRLEKDGSGEVKTVSGAVAFSLSGDILTVRLREDRGHFTKSLLVGGIRQMIEEANELREAVA